MTYWMSSHVELATPWLFTGTLTSSSVIATSRPWSVNSFIVASISFGVEPPIKWDSKPIPSR